MVILGNSGIFIINKNLLEIIKPPCIENDSNSVFHHIVKNAFI